MMMRSIPLFALVCSVAHVSVPGCSSPSGGTGGSSDTIDVEFAADPNNPLFATAATSDGAEFAFYADTAASDGAQTSSVNTRLADGTIVKASLDSDGRPEKIVVDETTANVEYDEGTAKVIVVTGDEISESDVPLPAEAARVLVGMDPRVTQSPPPGMRLCDRVRTYVETLRVLFDCQAGDGSARCAPAFVQFATASRRICTARQRLAAALRTTIASEPPLIPLRVQAIAMTSAGAEGLDVQLSAQVLGGRPPYRFNWFVGQGPVRPDIPDMQDTSVRLMVPGDYVLRVVVHDAQAQVGTAFVRLVTSETGLPPRVGAGPDRAVAPGATVMLLCMQLAGNPAMSFSWRQISGPTVPLMSSDRPAASFVAPQTAAMLEFECSATNAAGTGTDAVIITVAAP
jgi:hypothetical protein